MLETLFEIRLRDIVLAREIGLFVWADNADEAAQKLAGSLIGPGCEYKWLSTTEAKQGKDPITRYKLR